MFPHHEAEIAQQESASGLKPFVKYWMHAGFLVNTEKKMSKSLGNFMSLHEALKNYSPETLRFYFLSAHYRSPLDFSEEILKQSEAAVSRLFEFVQKLESITKGSTLDLLKGRTLDHTTEEIIRKIKEEVKTGFEESLSDDFNTPKSFASIFEMIKTVNPLLDSQQIGPGSAESILEILKNFNQVLGIVGSQTSELPAEVQELVRQRESAREAKDFSRADHLRSQIEALGYQIDNTHYGPLVKKTKK